MSTSSIAVGNAERFVIANGFDFFGQDSWQVTPNLNVNVGLRYEYFGPLHSNGTDDLGVFIPGKGLVVQGQGVNSIFPPDRNNFAPRAGFAYQMKNGFVLQPASAVFDDQINMNPFLDFFAPRSRRQTDWRIIRSALMP